MKKTGSALLLWILLLLPGMNPGASEAAGTIVAFGDSITAGYPYIENGNGCTYCLGYEYYLQYLLDYYQGTGAYVYNYGISGERLLTGGVNRIDSVMASTGADYVLIMEGTNDLRHYVNPETVAYNLSLVASKVAQQGGVPIVATLTPDTRYGADWKNIATTNEYIKSYNAQFCLSDQYSAMLPYWNSTYTDDYLHPNYWGYWLMAATWYTSLLNCGY